MIHLIIESYLAARRTIPCAIDEDRAVNIGGAAELLVAREQIDGMKALEESPRIDDLRFADDVERICAGIDHRGTCDADFWRQVSKGAADLATRYGRFTRSSTMRRINQVFLPEVARTGVRVECIQTVQLRGDKDDVVFGGVDGELPLQRLSVDGTVNRAGKKFSEGCGFYARRG